VYLTSQVIRDDFVRWLGTAEAMTVTHFYSYDTLFDRKLVRRTSAAILRLPLLRTVMTYRRSLKKRLTQSGQWKLRRRLTLDTTGKEPRRCYVLCKLLPVHPAILPILPPSERRYVSALEPDDGGGGPNPGAAPVLVGCRPPPGLLRSQQGWSS
jgi:hypothetical protein